MHFNARNTILYFFTFHSTRKDVFFSAQWPQTGVQWCIRMTHEACSKSLHLGPTLDSLNQNLKFGNHWSHHWGFPGGTGGKEPTCQCRRHKRHRFHPWVGKIPGGGHGNPLQYSCLDNPMDRGAWRATVHGVTKSLTQLKQLSMHAQSPISSKRWETTTGIEINKPEGKMFVIWRLWSLRKSELLLELILFRWLLTGNRERGFSYCIYLGHICGNFRCK